MPGLDESDFYESDSSDNDENHSRLLSSVSQLDSTQRVKPAQRKEVASEVSEYNLSQGISGRKDVVNVLELANVLGKKAEHGLITKKFKSVTKKSKTLPKPLERPTEERLKRSIGFENVKNQLRRWDAIVTRNAMSDRLCFPLNGNSVKMQKSSEFLAQFKSRTPLEEEMAAVLKEGNKKPQDEEMEDEFPLTLEEMLEKRKEMAQLRAKLSYKQAKAQRQSKIKSKKYHRLLKREKIREQLKEFEILQKTDPEAALKKLSELDKTRAQERASLRHRNTGHWARNLTVRAKYDVETRKVLAEQLKVSRDLTQKVSQLDSSDNEEAEPEIREKAFPVQPLLAAGPSENPWTLDVSKEVQDFVSGYRKFWNEKNKDTPEEKAGEGTNEARSEDDGTEAEIPVSGGECEKAKSEAKSPPKAKETTVRSVRSKTSVSISKGTNQAHNEDDGKEAERTGSGGECEKTKPKAKEATIKPKRSKTSVSICPASGVWLVTPLAEVAESEETRPKKTAEDIDSLFDELNEKLVEKAKKKAKKIKRKLNISESKDAKKKNVSNTEFDLSLRNTNSVQRPDMDAGLLEGDSVDVSESTGERMGLNDEGRKAGAPAIDPEKFIEVKPKRLRTALPEGGAGDEDALDDEKEQEKMMEEAFGDDDVMADFNEMKREEERKKAEVQTTLPGWGEWGGSGIVPKRKKKRLLVRNVPRKKAQRKPDVIINEKENPNLRSHLVKEVPHPFKSVEAFEANIRAPIGRDWVPETAHQKLIQKSIVTRLGTVIEPMNENEIVRLKKASKCPYKGKKAKEDK